MNDLSKYLWGNSIPDLNSSSIAIPTKLIQQCPSFVSDDNIIDYDLYESEISRTWRQKVHSWINGKLDRLNKSPGILLLKIEQSSFEDNQHKSMYFAIASEIGKLNDRYGDLFEVKNRNLDYKKERIPISKTNSGTGFHTDSTALKYSPDIVGLLCVQQAKEGGVSLLANAFELYEWMKIKCPESVKVLSMAIIRDVITPGSEANIEAIKNNSFPVFSVSERGFQFRYMRYWIISGHNRCGVKISSELDNAIEKIDEFLEKKENITQYKMKRGDMLFVNNNFICHNRTEYKESPNHPTRSLLRTWIDT